MTAQTIGDVMTKDPIVLSPTATLNEAASVMRDRAVGDVLVGDDRGLRGIVTDRDIVVRCLADGGEPGRTTLGDVCSANPVTVAPNTAIEDAIEQLRHQAIRRLPVVDGQQVVGIVSIGDLAMERDPTSALADISEAPPSQRA